MLQTNYINADNNGNEYSQYETSDATTYLAQSRFTPQEKEAGMLYVFYNAVNTATGAAVNKVKIVRYKMVNGVTTLIGAQDLFKNSDTGMTTVDVAAMVSDQDVVMSITGLAAATVRHTFNIQRVSSQLK